MSDSDKKPDRQNEVPELPGRILDTYARLWQLETWLRRLVYIELRASDGDNWASKIRGAERSRDADKRLIHMPTSEDDPLSYAQFSELCRVISDEWPLFEPFLPPKTIWEAKLEEVAQARHRVAHFRIGHRDDLQRVLQLLRDMDQGFWCFCTSYNHPHPVIPPSDDPVVEHFFHLDPFPWGSAGDGKWARYGMADPNARFGLTIEILCRPWAPPWSTPIAGNKGLIYDVTVSARQDRRFDYRRFLKITSDLHKHLIHICLGGRLAKDIRITIPAFLGSQKLIEIIQKIADASLYSLDSSSSWESDERLADQWPEYVLGPENPLSFLTRDMPCSFFGV